MQQPSFITGLQLAKKILIDLRNSKAQPQSEQVVESPPKKELSLSANSPQPKSIQESSEKCEELSMQRLKRRVNAIGSQLHSCYLENEKYESIFSHLVSHYSQNKSIVEENEKLKKKAYQLQQMTQEYRKKIQQNTQQIEQQQKESHALKKIVTEELTIFLEGEINRAKQQPLEKISQSPYLGQFKQESEEQDAEQKITLRYKQMPGLIGKKMSKKVSAEEDIRKSFYQSELYTL